MKIPVIGITCGEDSQADQLILKNYYVKAVEAAGGCPVLVPVVFKEDIRGRYRDLIDGLILSGGVDVDPEFFGEEPEPGLGEITPNRDMFEIALVKELFPLEKPIMAICRGTQLLNIALGGSIYQDIHAYYKKCLKHMQQAPKWYPTHWVDILTGAKLGKILDRSRLRVNSFHHQAIKLPAPGFNVAALATDGIIEAIEAPDHPFALGVQWHPECSWETDRASFQLFQAFIEACTGK